MRPLWGVRRVCTVLSHHRHSRVGAIAISDRRFHTVEGHSGRCELDSHADTCVAGANFAICEFDGMTCEVSPYTESYESMKDVPIVGAATAWTNVETGETHILYFNQMLWYGGTMPMSLINPNQMRYFGHSLCDDVTDRNREFGILLEDYAMTIPFAMSGTTVYFESRVPSQWELQNCNTIIMTDESWDPATVSLADTSSSKWTREEQEWRTISLIQSKPEESIWNDGQLASISEVHDDKYLIKRLIASVNVATHIRTNTPVEENNRKVSFIGAKNRHTHVTTEEVARILRCGMETAKQTLKVTTQRGVRQALHPLHRRYRVDHLNLNRKRINDTFYTDTLFSKTKSLNGMRCAQVYTNGRFTKVYPMESKSSACIANSLQDFADDVGIPETLVCDLATEQTGKNTPMMKEVRRLRIRMRNSEKGRSNQNHKAETEIRELKKRWKTRMVEKNVPKRLWDYGLVYMAEILSITARGSNQRPGLEEISGQTIDISEWLDFEFYDSVWYWDEKKTDMTDDQGKVGRWLGIAHRIGSDMTYWILTKGGNVIARSTVQHITLSDMAKDTVKTAVQEYDAAVITRLNDDAHLTDEPGIFYLDDDNDEEGETGETPTDEEYGDMLHEDKPNIDDTEMYDRYLNAEFVVDRGGEQVRARVAKRARFDTGAPIGQQHSNPLLDTREYECITEDGVLERYSANIIAENIYSQCDTEGHSFLVLQEIADHKSDLSAITIDNGFDISHNGNRTAKKTTRGWHLLCNWKDGSCDWVALKDLKDSNPVELAEYAVANRIQDEPAFKWWVADVLRKRNRIISKVKSRYWKTTHKFGVRLPHGVDEALRIDEATGTDFWLKAIKKEMDKVNVAFEFCENWTPEQVRRGIARGDFVGFQEIKCHMIFDVKMDLTRKARMVAGGHTTETPASLTYSSVVSRDSVRIALLIAALNDLDIMACDIGNAYLNAPCREKIWFVAGPEFGSKQGQVVKVVRALYGLKSSGASWRNMLQETIQTEMGFTPTQADPDVYRRRSAKPDGFEYWELLLVYVDDILIISHEPKVHLNRLNQFYEFNMASVGTPERYLGTDIGRCTMPNDATGAEYWSMSSHSYVRNAVQNVKLLLNEEGRGLKSTAKTPFTTTYRPELDTTDELNDELSSRYSQLIGVLRWAVELGRIDIYYEVSVLSQHLALPRVGHLEAVYHIFAYLMKHDKSRIIFDPADPIFDDQQFPEVDWTEFYGDMVEELPPRMPEPLGNPVNISVFVDANHAGNAVTRRSHSGILIYLQNAPIIWQSRRQNTVETSTFGSEFVALRTARDLVVALRYKLRMFGIPLIGPARVFCDNQGVVKNTSVPESVLSKKHNAVNYHAVREAAASKILIVGKEDGTSNLADLFTKSLTSEKRKALLSSILFNF